MAIKTLILGYSGTGKSASLRNFDPDEILIINCANKPLPFKNKFEIRDVNGNANDIIEIMSNAKEQVIVIDDCQYIMSFEYMRRIHENGWEKCWMKKFASKDSSRLFSKRPSLMTNIIS